MQQKEEMRPWSRWPSAHASLGRWWDELGRPQAPPRTCPKPRGHVTGEVMRYRRVVATPDRIPGILKVGGER